MKAASLRRRGEIGRGVAATPRPRRVASRRRVPRAGRAAPKAFAAAEAFFASNPSKSIAAGSPSRATSMRSPRHERADHSSTTARRHIICCSISKSKAALVPVESLPLESLRRSKHNGSHRDTASAAFMPRLSQPAVARAGLPFCADRRYPASRCAGHRRGTCRLARSSHHFVHFGRE